MEYYAGCNYWINRGKNEFEPIGTATSMHDCGNCEELNHCQLKKKTEIWEYNDNIKQQMNKDWNEMISMKGDSHEKV